MFFVRPSLSITNCSHFYKPNFFNARKVLLKKTTQSCVRSSSQISVSAQTPNRIIGKWLLGLSGMTFGAIVLGGLTRLTESGLSIVDWHPFKEAPPMNEEQWLNEFNKYKMFPEYQYNVKENDEMSLQKFKFIWYMEYIHRMWGRTIGVAFLMPASYFLFKGYFSKSMKIRVFLYGSLIGLQGLLGWLMVRTGLNEPKRPAGISSNEEYVGVPRVSHYWLCGHLCSAVVLYTMFLHSAFSHLVSHPPVKSFKELKKLKIISHSTKLATFLTIIYGAFVAGLDAGLVYNSWPKMADRWIPEDLIVSRYGSTLRNFIDNPVAVQFVHRLLAYSTLTGSALLCANILRLGVQRTGPRIFRAGNLVFGCALGQGLLGIITLLNYVPVPLASMHQAGSLVLFSSLIWFTHCLRAVPK